MYDELAAYHLQVKILLLSMCDISIRKVWCVRRRMKRVARCVYAHKSHSIPHRVQQCLLAFGRHRGLAVRSQSREIARREEHHTRVGVKLFRIENSPVLRHADFESML